MIRHAAFLRASTSLFALTVIAAVSGASAQSQPASAVPTANLPILARQGQVSLDEITVTPSRQEERAIDALAAVSVVSRTDLRIWAPQRIGTVVNTIPGVATQENPNDPATAINIRGLQDFGRVAVTIDGARQNFQRSGHNANGAFFLDPAFIRTIDVTRGPVANLYGSGAIGGVVSFETVDPKDILRPGERAAAEIGGTGVFSRQSGWYGNVIGAARPTDWAAGLLGLSFRSLNGYRDGDGTRILDSGQDLKSGLGKIVLTPGDGHELKLGGQYQRYEFSNGLGTSGSPRRDNEVATQNYTGQYSFSRPDLPWLNLKASAYSTATDTDQTQLSGRGAALGAKRFFKIETQGVDVQNTMKFDLGAAALNLSYGADWFQDRVRTGDPVGNGDETTPSGKRSVYGGFVQAHVKYGIVDLIGALRYDSYELSGGRTSSDGQRALAEADARRHAAAGPAALRHLCRGLSRALHHRDPGRRAAPGPGELRLPPQSEPQARDRQDAGGWRQPEIRRRPAGGRPLPRQARGLPQRRHQLSSTASSSIRAVPAAPAATPAPTPSTPMKTSPRRG